MCVVKNKNNKKTTKKKIFSQQKYVQFVKLTFKGRYLVAYLVEYAHAYIDGTFTKIITKTKRKL